jgi:predicted RNase H-like nuclease
MKRRIVLGIDAAWTEREPSGIALVADDGTGWGLVDAAASYDGFLMPSGGEPIVRHRGSIPDVRRIISAVELKTGSMPDLVAIDMPLSSMPIVGRRGPDNLISSLYGARGGGTHSPSALRPGQISDGLRVEFDAAGYPLAVAKLTTRDLIEVYPHPALIELASAERRLPYKHSKIGKYWRQETPAVRRQKLLEVWARIVDLLDGQVQGTKAALLLPAADARGHQMKAFEDKLDAVVCAWVGACAMDGRAIPFGDSVSAIWVPTQM